MHDERIEESTVSGKLPVFVVHLGFGPIPIAENVFITFRNSRKLVIPIDDT